MAAEDLVDWQLTESVIKGFLDSYYKLGFGFLESIYASALARELAKRGHRVSREVGVEVLYDGERIGWFRFDMLVDDRLVVEIKASEALPSHAKRQLRNYLAATRLELGLLLHYGPVPQIRRVIATNDFRRVPSSPRVP